VVIYGAKKLGQESEGKPTHRLMNGMLAMFTHSSTAFRNIHLQQSPTHHVDWKTSTSDKGGGERIG